MNEPDQFITFIGECLQAIELGDEILHHCWATPKENGRFRAIAIDREADRVTFERSDRTGPLIGWERRQAARAAPKAV